MQRLCMKPLCVWMAFCVVANICASNAAPADRFDDNNAVQRHNTKRANAETINGLLRGFNAEDLQRLHMLGKRANAELLNGLASADISDLARIGKRANAELVNGLMGMDFGALDRIGKRANAELVNGLNGFDMDALNRWG